MREVPGSVPSARTDPAAQDLRLLLPHQSGLSVFVRNFSDLLRRPEPGPNLEFAPGIFWPDVFVHSQLPWQRFLQSGACHILALAMIWAGSRFLTLQPHVIPQSTFTRADVVYYTPSEYLPPVDTRRPTSAPAQKADPEYSTQPIISVPAEADNRSQTIVTPQNVRLQAEVASPNMVALLEKMPGDTRMPIGPAPLIPASETSRLAPRMERSVIAPPPEVHVSPREALPAPQPSVIAPPPTMESSSTRRVGDLNIGRSPVIAPAPQLSLDERHTVPGRTSATLSNQAVIAPPPSLAASGRARSGGLIALSLHPAVGAPHDPPAGNRRGTFAVTPAGHRGASGAPGASSGDGNARETGSGKTSHELPSGLYVGKTANATSPVADDPAPKNSTAGSVNPNLMASARPPRVSARSLQPETETKLSQEERAVFGGRKFYSLSLSMPNLNSAGGSWIVRFAALKDANSGGAPSRSESSENSAAADLSAPTATHKVDPAYPLGLMRQNVGGTVILYAIIHADGTVSGIRVLRSVDERLDNFASSAIAKWQFQPATKNGTPVDVEATFWIPFRPAKAHSSF